jgi:type IV pilus assembly protein PilX
MHPPQEPPKNSVHGAFRHLSKPAGPRGGAQRCALGQPIACGGAAPPSRQRGIVLVVALIMLTIITLLGVSAMQVTSMEERMAGNARDRSLAFQAAEAALRDGERFLTQAVLPTFDGTNGLYPAPAAGAMPIWAQADGSLQGKAFWETNGRVYGDTVDGVAEQPRYVIEEISVCRPGVGDSWKSNAPCEELAEFYRVTARGIGGSANAIVVLQSTYKRR